MAENTAERDIVTPIELRAALKELGWSQKHFAEVRMGVHPATVGRWCDPKDGANPVPYAAAEIIRINLQILGIVRGS